MRKIIGILLMLAGIGLGIYVGFWLMFVGGILGIAKAIDLHTITGTLVAMNIIKIIFGSAVGSIIGYLGVTFGSSLLFFEKKNNK